MLRRQALMGSLAVAAWPAIGRAQPARKTARVGWLGLPSGMSPVGSVPVEELRADLAELGWKEGVNLVLLAREGERAQGASLVGQLVRANVDVIVATGGMVFPARTHTGSTPLVFTISGDPVEAGLVTSMARPGGNLTGITTLSIELSGKRIELLKAAQPGIKRVAALGNDSHPGRRLEQDASLAAAQRLGFELKYYPVLAPQDFDAAFAAIADDRASAMVSFSDVLITRQAKVIAEFSARQRLPSISCWSEFAQAGNLMSYGTGHREYFRRTATYVDRLLRGAKPGDLPVEQPTRFELVINRTTARSIGVTLQNALLARADEVIG